MGQDRTGWGGRGGGAPFEGAGRRAPPRSRGADRGHLQPRLPARPACCRPKPSAPRALPAPHPSAAGAAPGRQRHLSGAAPTEGKAAVSIPGAIPPLPRVKPRCVPSRFSPSSVNTIPFGMSRRKISRFTKRVSHTPLGIYPRAACAQGRCLVVATRGFGLGAPRSSQPSRPEKAGCEGTGGASRAEAETGTGTGTGTGDRDREQGQPRSVPRCSPTALARGAPWRPLVAPSVIGGSPPTSQPRVTSPACAPPPSVMGKSRGGAAKGGSVFRIARSAGIRAKAKGKARPVTSGLKQVSAAAGGGAGRAAVPAGGLGPAGVSPLGPRRAVGQALGNY